VSGVNFWHVTPEIIAQEKEDQEAGVKGKETGHRRKNNAQKKESRLKEKCTCARSESEEDTFARERVSGRKSGA